jgi:hypothetical protein
MIGATIKQAVDKAIEPFETSRLAWLLKEGEGPYAIKFVKSRWAVDYLKASRLKISDTPALTWGTATYVTPLLYPLSSALYGRIGLVTDFDPRGWRIFDATVPASRMAYLQWARVQPAFSDLLLTVHSTHANHLLRNQFRKAFAIDCVLFHPDQEADLHTDKAKHIWMAVTDWTGKGEIDSNMSNRLQNARFTVLLDEDFVLEEKGLPIQKAERQIEKATEKIMLSNCLKIAAARTNPSLPAAIVQQYQNSGYLHLYIEP